MGFAPARRFDFFSLVVHGRVYFCVSSVLLQKWRARAALGVLLSSPSVFDSSCYSVVCMLYIFSAPFQRRGGLKLNPPN